MSAGANRLYLLEVYLSSVSNRLNEIMKILTMFTAFFIPLSLIAGICGMNFNTARSPFNMPELNWYLGYPFVFGLMAVVALGMRFFFIKKGWLRSRLGLDFKESQTRNWSPRRSGFCRLSRGARP